MSRPKSLVQGTESTAGGGRESQVRLIRAIKTYWCTQDPETSFSQGIRGEKKPLLNSKKTMGK